MKAYLVVTGILFALLTIIHIWRVIAESSSLARDPFFVLITVASALLTYWATRLLLAVRSGPPVRES